MYKRQGLPGKPLGLKLHWLESETSIKLSDLPEDTQNRIKAGIPQTSVDEAQDTEVYKRQGLKMVAWPKTLRMRALASSSVCGMLGAAP